MIRSHHFSAVLTTPEAIAHLSSTELLNLMKTAVLEAGLSPVGETTATFEPQGASAVLLLEESHVALHTWPEDYKITADIHVCDFHQDNYAKAKKLATVLTTKITGCCDDSQWQYLTTVG